MGALVLAGHFVVTRGGGVLDFYCLLSDLRGLRSASFSIKRVASYETCTICNTSANKNTHFRLESYLLSSSQTSPPFPQPILLHPCLRPQEQCSYQTEG